jgi:copper chaperone
VNRIRGVEMSSTVTLPVVGMTCGHCVQAVTQELTALDGVQDVAVELVPDGTTLVTVTSAAPLDDAAVRAAIDEAGYDIAH